MNKSDNNRFTRLEKQIINQGAPNRLTQLFDFPYKNLDELGKAHRSKDIIIGSNYNGEFIQVIGTKGDNVMHFILILLPIIIVFTDILLAIVFKKWILLWGILFAFIGFLASSPFTILKKPISGIGGILFIASFFIFDWTWSVLIGSMVLSQIFTLAAREHYRKIIEERALQSEVLFCYMLKNKYLFVKDVKTNKVYHAS